ncbi:MAG: hypothetical protein J6T62_07510 [Fibrobacter sp.]|nr:hypothetical protein [Fibrobacter sp.]
MTMNNETEMKLATIQQNSADLSKEFSILEAGTGAKIRHTTTSDDVTLFNALNDSAEKVEDYLGKEVTVSDIVVTSADVLQDINDDEDGDKENRPVVHFFTTDGLHISSISNGIRRAAMNLLEVGFAPSPERPIVIKFKEVKTKKGTAHSFTLISR